MPGKITLGHLVNVKVIKTPRNLAAAKTLVRLLSKDPIIAAENKRLTKVRMKNFRTISRGGRPYPIRPVKQRPVKGQAGESGTIRATVDVLSDLSSVSRFVEVSKA